MKKVLIILCVAVLILSGCTSSTVKRLMEETKLAITDGDFAAAQNYGELAIKEGCKDEEFIALAEILKNYTEAKNRVEAGDIDAAKASLEKIKDTDGSGMTQAVDKLKKEIEEKEKNNEIYKKIVTVENAFDVGDYNRVLKDAQELLDKEELADEQKSHIESLLGQAMERLDAASEHFGAGVGAADQPGGKAMLTEQEAIDRAKEAMEISPSARVTVTLNGEIYTVNVETDYTYNGVTNTDEKCCMVDAKTGEIVGLAG